jgi:hypothetical protein
MNGLTVITEFEALEQPDPALPPHVHQVWRGMSMNLFL